MICSPRSKPCGRLVEGEAGDESTAGGSTGDDIEETFEQEKRGGGQQKSVL